MVVFYLPLVALGCALLLPMVKNGAHVGIFVFGVVLLMEYMIVIPSLGYKLIVLARRRFEWLAEQRYVEHYALLTDGLHVSHSALFDSFTPRHRLNRFRKENPKTGKRGSLVRSATENVLHQIDELGCAGIWCKIKPNFGHEVKDGLLEALQLRHRQRNLLHDIATVDAVPHASICRSRASEAKQKHMDRLKEQIAKSNASIDEQDKKCFALFSFHEGAAVDSLWLCFEEGWHFWKVASVWWDKALFVVLFIILTEQEATLASCAIAVALTAVSLLASLKARPFISSAEDRVDNIARVANCANAILALILVVLYGDNASDKISNQVNETMTGNGTAVSAVRQHSAYIWYVSTKSS